MSDPSRSFTLVATREATTDAFAELLESPSPFPVAAAPHTKIDGVLVGTLVAFADDGTMPLVVYTGQPQSAAIGARTTVDLHAAHIGRDVVLMFEYADPLRPIIVGCLHNGQSNPLRDVPGNVEVDADGKRMIVSAREQMVLRCGKASITLTRSGKVLIEGAYVASRSSGVLRLKGGAVQIN
jgi:hypothetical protein